MSVGFANAVADGLRYNGITVTFEPGWETRGNGLVFPNGRPEGLITHHTGSGYGAGLSTLIVGRPDLSPPLCNCCTYPDGRIHIIAAHVANHAGASGGKSMGPLPTTTLFNPRVWGNEVMFPGTQPWTPAQYNSARILAGVICGILGRPSPEWARGHWETSISGKWDPGVGNGTATPFDMNRFRREIMPALQAARPIPKPPEVDVPLTNDEIARIASASAAATLDAQIARGGYTQTGSGPTTPRGVIGYWDHAQVLDRNETEAVGKKVDDLEAKVDAGFAAILELLNPKAS
jgi:hypothetical protein